MPAGKIRPGRPPQYDPSVCGVPAGGLRTPPRIYSFNPPPFRPPAGHPPSAAGGLPGLTVSRRDPPSLSRRHGLTEFTPPAARVVDLESKSGTRVNGPRVTTADLRTGDRVKAGATVLLVRLPAGEAD